MSAVDFSVVVVSYNRPDKLARAVESAFAQTGVSVEVIVCDNGSSFDLHAVLPNPRDGLVLMKLAGNRGPSGARNAGAAVATGRFVAFLDDDDWWATDKLAAQGRALEAFDVCLAAQRPAPGRAPGSEPRPLGIRELRHGNRICGASGLAVRREVLRSVRFDETVWMGEDWDFYVTALEQGFSACVLDDRRYLHYEVSAASLSNDPRKRLDDRVLSKLRVLEKHRATIGSFHTDVRVAGTCLRYVDAGNARTMLLESVRRAGLAPTLYYLAERAGRRIRDAIAAK